MKFGIREIADVVFKAKKDTWIGNSEFKKGQPVLYIDSAKTSTIESAATTVYATGGRGNSRLITWEGEKTLTFTVEDALLSPIGFSILSGAGLFNDNTVEKAMVHRTEMAEMIIQYNIDGQGNRPDELQMKIVVDALNSTNNKISNSAPIYVSILKNNSIISGIKHLKQGSKSDTYDYTNSFVFSAVRGQDQTLSTSEQNGWMVIPDDEYMTKKTMLSLYGLSEDLVPENDKMYKYPCIVDYYTEKTGNVTELVIDADNFGGYYYVEGTTYVRNESGKDMKMTLTFPKVKVQSNFTFNMASNGDPSTFSFVMDAMPDYTMFEATKKVLCAMQLIEEEEIGADMKPVLTLGEKESVDIDIIGSDSVDWGGIPTEPIILEQGAFMSFNISNLAGEERSIAYDQSGLSGALIINGLTSSPTTMANGETKTIELTNNNTGKDIIPTTLSLLDYSTTPETIIAKLDIELKPFHEIGGEN